MSCTLCSSCHSPVYLLVVVTALRHLAAPVQTMVLLQNAPGPMVTYIVTTTTQVPLIRPSSSSVGS